MVVVENNAQTRGRPFRAGEPNPGFKPGQSGNPGGSPKGLARRIRDEVGADGGDLITVMLEIARDRDGVRRDRMQAVEWLVVRGWGRAPDIDPELKLFPTNFDFDKLTSPAFGFSAKNEAAGSPWSASRTFAFAGSPRVAALMAAAVRGCCSSARPSSG